MNESSDCVAPSDKYSPLSAGKTFWDEGQFDAVVKRLENGKRSLKDFLFMVEERAGIEKRYADKLHSWYNKWALTIKQGPEYGEIQKVWQSVLIEGRRIADIHFRLSLKLGLQESDGILKSVNTFKKTNYHGLPLQKELKEVKECKEAFKSIQAPYKKAIEQINKCKKKYLEISKNCLKLVNKLREREKSSVTSETGSKQSKLDTLNIEKEKAKSKYLDALKYFNDNVCDTYSRDMRLEFQRCQDFECERMTVLLNSLHDYIGVVNRQAHTNDPLSSIYFEAASPLKTVKPENNLHCFAEYYGASMATNFPKFEDADTEPMKSQLSNLTDAARRPTNFLDFKGKSLLLNRLKYLRSEGQLTSHARSPTKDFMLRRPSYPESLGTSSRNSEFKQLQTGLTARHSLGPGMAYSPLVINDKSSDDNVVVASKDHYAMDNVYVRVISDFAATHTDHLEIVKGEVVYQIRGDDNGWCYGRIAYKEGIYPSKAVRLLTMKVFPL